MNKIKFEGRYNISKNIFSICLKICFFMNIYVYFKWLKVFIMVYLLVIDKFICKKFFIKF